MKIRWKMKLLLCGLLVLFAGLSAAVVLSNLGVLPASTSGEGEYVLRARDGYVSVFYPSEAEEPSMITDIRVADLPAGDRRDLQMGIFAPDYEQMIALLEGLSS